MDNVKSIFMNKSLFVHVGQIYDVCFHGMGKFTSQPMHRVAMKETYPAGPFLWNELPVDIRRAACISRDFQMPIN